ncbi:diguanylate cyclase domain-containing protein [Pseudoduganella violaceinigra]|uniref:diguanylate cyclase domain-containing protein n=1 Tax=Pseudoduganella violaceinigra TaxID=246602 RepID=UPI000428E978|nr:diguanylate cyclase [Pseudoduganella violaceinigra]
MLSETSERATRVGLTDLLRAMQYLPVGMSIMDRDLLFRFWNDSFCQCLDFPDSLMQEGVSLEDLFRFNARRGEFGPGDPDAQVRERIGLARQFVAHRFRRTRANGTVLQVTGRPMSDDAGRVVGFVTIYEDVTTEARQQQELEQAHRKLLSAYEDLRRAQLDNSALEKDRSKYYQLAVRDAVTGLYTRHYMEDAAARLLEQHERDHAERLGLLVFDVDRFKSINDNHGHLAGDTVLQRIGELLNSHTRRIDIAVRNGGDEFAIFLPKLDLRLSLQFAERLRGEVRALRLGGELDGIALSISAGVAEHQLGESLGDLLQRADAALYAAKRGGRDRVCSFPAHPA